MSPTVVRNTGSIPIQPAGPASPPTSASTMVPGEPAAVARPADSFVPAPPATGGDGAGFPASLFPAGNERWGSWVWNPGPLDTLLTTLKSAGANELYLNAYPLLGRESFLKEAVTRASASGLSPQLLMGSPEWIDPQTRPWLEQSILAPLREVRAAVPAATARRLVVHLDIEPHATGSLTPEKMRGYLDTLSWLGEKLGPGFSLQVDIPAWYQGQMLDGKNLADEILKRVDSVTLMAYGRSADQVIAEVGPTLAQAAKLGKQALVALEVGPQYQQVGLGTQPQVRQFLARVDAALSGRPGYGGCALHDLEAMSHLPW